MRVVLVGTVESTLVAFDALNRAGHPPVLVVTLPIDARNRHSDFADLSAPARAKGIAVHHTSDVNAQATLEAIRAVSPDLSVVIGWSQVCKAALHETRLGALGFHPAPLPRMRGRAVIPWTILLDEKETGSTLFWLDEGVDSGAILLQRRFPVAEDDTARSLYQKHMHALAGMLAEAMDLIRSGKTEGTPQDHAKATYCAKRTPADGRIDWRSPAASVLRLIRAVGDPYPGAFSVLHGESLIIDKALPFSQSRQFIGLAGQVQSHTESGFTVRCGDGELIDVKAWRWPRGGRPRIHSKFGEGG